MKTQRKQNERSGKKGRERERGGEGGPGNRKKTDLTEDRGTLWTLTRNGTKDVRMVGWSRGLGKKRGGGGVGVWEIGRLIKNN